MFDFLKRKDEKKTQSKQHDYGQNVGVLFEIKNYHGGEN